MASCTRAKRRRSMPTLLPSIEADSNDARLSPSRDNVNGEQEAKDTGSAAVTLRSEQLEERPRQLYRCVLGATVPVPQTFDPDTYDLDGRIPGTPQPEPYDPETYAAWGRKHFGEEWYELRKTMLEERNTYLKYDLVYLERQRALRIMEHQTERRPFKPLTVYDKDWERLWPRLSKKLGIEIPPSPTPSQDSDGGETDLSGYDTYDPTPSPREPSPMPDDPWEKLEYDRRRFNWGEEEYQFEKFFLREGRIDAARTRHENEPGNRLYRERQEKMESFRYEEPHRFSLERQHFQNHIDLPKKGWTIEEIVAKYEVDVAWYEWRKENHPPRRSGAFGDPATPAEEAARASWVQQFEDAWVHFYGSFPPKRKNYAVHFGVFDLWAKGTHARLCRRRQREALLSDATLDASSRAEALQRIEDEEQEHLETLKRAVEREEELAEKAANMHRLPPPQTQEEMNHRFRLMDELGWSLEGQNRMARRYGFGDRSAKLEVLQSPAMASQPAAKDTSRRTCGGRITDNAPAHVEPLTQTAPPKRKKQRKIYSKERASRRLAKMEPEYGMLGGSEIQHSPRQLPNTRRTGI